MPTMNRTEAHNHIVNNVPVSFSVKAPSLRIIEEDDIRQWSAEFEDTLTNESGWTVFDEHYGEVEVSWE